MAVQTDNRFELYKLITGLTKSTEVIYWDCDLNTNYTESRLYNESLYILKNNEFQYINLANSNQNNEKFSNQFQTVGLSELNNTSFSKIQNFIMLNECKAAILLEEKIAIYDLVKEKLVSCIDKTTDFDSDSDDYLEARKVVPNNNNYAKSTRTQNLLKIQDQNTVWYQDRNLNFVDIRTSSIKCCLQSSINCFDVNSVELITLENKCLKYYDIRKANHGINMNGNICLYTNDREPYTYFKSDNHRMGLMSSSSLLFKNHGEINLTVGKEVVNYSNRPTNSINTDKYCVKYPDDPFVKLHDFDYFDRFYCTFTHSLIYGDDCPSMVNLYEVKTINQYNY